MANNRMFLVNKRTGTRVYLAKYYPSTGWYTDQEDLSAKLNMEFDKADFGHLTEEQRAENRAVKGFGVPHKSPGGMCGAEWEIQYEIYP